MIDQYTMEAINAYADATDGTLDAFMADQADGGGFVCVIFRHGQYAAHKLVWEDAGVPLEMRSATTIMASDLKDALGKMDELSSKNPV